MQKLVFITGQLIMEIRARAHRAEGNRRLIDGTSILPGGRTYRQALFAKEEGYSVILLGRLGDDHYGKTILQSLSAVGISTQFIEINRADYTGLSFEVIEAQGAAPLVYFDPGASVGQGDFQTPIQSYLPLCDAVLINQWFHPDACTRIVRQAQEHMIPTIYVCSTPPRDGGALEVDYLFLDQSEQADPLPPIPKSVGPRVLQGTYLWSGGRLRSFNARGRETAKLDLDPAMNSDRIVTRLMDSIIQGREIDESALRSRGAQGG